MADAVRTTWRTGAVRDAHGRAVSQLDPVLLHLRHEHTVIPERPLRAIARQIGPGLTRANQVTMWAGIVGLLCLVIGVAILSVRLSNGTIGVRRFVASLIPLSAVWVTLFAFWMGTRGVRFQRTKAVLLEHGYCPHCGYNLEGLELDARDGSTVCPECGCAWLVTPAPSARGSSAA